VKHVQTILPNFGEDSEPVKGRKVFENGPDNRSIIEKLKAIKCVILRDRLAKAFGAAQNATRVGTGGSLGAALDRIKEKHEPISASGFNDDAEEWGV
jgi:hypothetical protein